MKRTMGLISTNYTAGDFGLLTEARPIASIPYAGRYRLVDFALSNMVNSGIHTVGLITPHLYRSLLDHVGNGKEWALSRKVGGMFILPGSTYGLRGARGKFLIRDIIGNRAYLERSHRDVVVITAASKVFNMDYRDVVKAHEKSGASVTLIYKNIPSGAGLSDPDVKCDDTGRVTRIIRSDAEKSASVRERIDSARAAAGAKSGMGKELSASPAEISGREESGAGSAETGACPGGYNQFMDAILIDREMLIKIIDWYSNLNYLDLMDVIIDNLDQLRVYGYEFKGYVKAIDSAADIMSGSQELLDPVVLTELFASERLILTKVQDAYPTKYGPESTVKNSLVAAGCIVNGYVENSVVFRGCIIDKGAVIKNSVILPSNQIAKDVYVENVICDKFVRLKEGVSLKGLFDRPLIVTKKQYS